MAASCYIASRPEGWFVVAFDGNKDCGGPFGKSEDAVAHLVALDTAAVKAASAVGSALGTPTAVGNEPPKKKSGLDKIHVFSRPHAFSVAVGVWDQLCKVGQFDKDGPVDFSPEKLAEGMANYVRRKNRLAMDHDHQALNASENGQPAPSLARYSCMALVVGGVVTQYDDSKDPGVPPPTTAELVNPKTGRVEDGLYIYRCEVTPLGEQLLPNYENISPAFTLEGADEQGNPCGLDFINLAATDIPFLDGMKPLELSRFNKISPVRRATTFQGDTQMTFDLDGMSAAMKKMADDGADAMKKFAEGDDKPFRKFAGDIANYRKAFDDADAAMKKKFDGVDGMAAAFKKLDDDSAAAMKKFDDSAGAMKKFDDTDGLKKFDEAMASMRAALSMWKKLDDAVSDPDGDDDKKMAKILGCAPTKAAIREAVTVLKYTTAPKEEIAALRKQVGELEAREQERTAKSTEKELDAFVDQALADQRWDGEDRAGLHAFAKLDRKAAEKSLKPKGFWGAMKRLTSKGQPLDAKRTDPVDLTVDGEDSVGGELVKAAAEEMKANPKLTFEQASTIAFKKNPALYRK